MEYVNGAIYALWRHIASYRKGECDVILQIPTPYKIDPLTSKSSYLV